MQRTVEEGIPEIEQKLELVRFELVAAEEVAVLGC
jgi:hypothetical protein